MAKHFDTGKIIALPKEAAEQYDIASKAIEKLTDISGIGWHLIADRYYKKNLSLSALAGATVTGAAVGVAMLVKKARKKIKTNQESKDK